MEDIKLAIDLGAKHTRQPPSESENETDYCFHGTLPVKPTCPLKRVKELTFWCMGMAAARSEVLAGIK